MSAGISAEDFLASYADSCGLTVEDILARRVVATCHCGEEICEGWQVIPEDCLLPWREEKVLIRRAPLAPI